MSPADAAFTRRELFLWFAAILFATKFSQSFLQIAAFAFGGHAFIHVAGLGAFQLLGWFVVFRLLVKEPADVAATAQDLAIVAVLSLTNVALGVTNALPAQKVVWIVATLGAIYIYFGKYEGVEFEGRRHRADGALRAGSLGADFLFAFCI